MFISTWSHFTMIIGRFGGNRLTGSSLILMLMNLWMNCSQQIIHVILHCHEFNRDGFLNKLELWNLEKVHWRMTLKRMKKRKRMNQLILRKLDCHDYEHGRGRDRDRDRESDHHRLKDSDYSQERDRYLDRDRERYR